MELLRTENIAKSYKGNPAVRDISIGIAKGSFYGLLGPNGAGKTTTINMISTLLKPDAGNILLDGKDIFSDTMHAKMQMGIVPQEIALYSDMSAWDNLLFWGRLYKLGGAALKKRAEEVLHWTGLFERRHEKIKLYSGGMQRRINIAAALLHEPTLLIMDEPTVGIDPQSRNKIYELLGELHKNGITILYTTHYMQEAESLCDRIAIIDHGRIIAEGSLEALKQQDATEETLVFSFAEEMPREQTLARIPFAHTLQDHTLHISGKNVRSSLQEILRLLADDGAQIKNIDVREVNLETIFLNLTGRALRE